MSEHTEIVKTSTDGKTRAVIVRDDTRDQPDGDCYGHVYLIDGRRVEELHQGYADVAPNLSEALNRFDGDFELVIRYARMFLDVVVVDQRNTESGNTLLELVTRTTNVAWGNDPEAASADLTEWEAWANGDVWGIRVERLATWVTEDDDLDDETCWTTIGESEVWGHYGHEWAERAAVEQLSYYA